MGTQTGQLPESLAMPDPITVESSEDMEHLGECLARVCPAGARIYLQGELGAGKTTLVRGFLRALDYQDKVKSPTYTLVEPYQLGTHSIFHFDLYRINDPLELEAIGIRDYLDGTGICLVEWPEKAQDFLPGPDILFQITIQDHGRQVKIKPATGPGERMLTKFVSLV